MYAAIDSKGAFSGLYFMVFIFIISWLLGSLMMGVVLEGYSRLHALGQNVHIVAPVVANFQK